MSILRFYLRLNRGHLRRHALEFVLCVIGVALGVAVVVGIDAAVVACVASFRGAVRDVAGLATHSIVGDSVALDDDDYVALRLQYPDLAMAPILDRRVVIDDPAGSPQVVRLLGIDPLSDGQIRSFTDLESSIDDTAFERLLCEPRTVIAVQGLAEQLALVPGDTLHLTVPAGRSPVELLAVVVPPGPLAGQVDDVLMADIATAQELTTAIGMLDRIDLVLKSTAQRDTLEASLPEHLTVVATATRADQLNELIAAYKLNLGALSLMASLVAIFIVYNALLVSVQQRTQTMAVLRCVGASALQLSGIYLVEALLTSALGSAVGVLCGIFLADVLVGYVAGTITDLYAALRPPAVHLSSITLIKGAIIGVCSGLVGAAVPLFRAARIPPITVLSHSAARRGAQHAAYVLCACGLIMLCVAFILERTPQLNSPAVAFVIAALTAVGFTLLCPLLTRAISAALCGIGRRMRNVPLSMAAGSVGHSLHITGFAVGAMMLAMAMNLALVTMITSFRTAVGTWLDQRFQADVFIGPQLTIDHNIAAPLDPAVIAWVSRQPEVQSLITYRRVTASVDDQRIQLLGTGVQDLLQQKSLPLRHGPLPNTSFDPLRHVLISEPLGGRLGVACGDTLKVNSGQSSHSFVVYAIYFDFTSDRGEAMLQGTAYRQLFDDDIINSMHIGLPEDRRITEVVDRWSEQLEPHWPVLVHDYAYVKNESMRIFDRTFRVTDVLAWMSCAVAYCGLVGALVALAMSRRREHGILAALGMSGRQVVAWVLAEGVIIAWLSAGMAVCAGTVLAYILAYVIQYRSFGWSIPMAPQFALWPSVFGYALAAALLAAVYPVHRLLKHPAQAACDRSDY